MLIAYKCLKLVRFNDGDRRDETREKNNNIHYQESDHLWSMTINYHCDNYSEYNQLDTNHLN